MLPIPNEFSVLLHAWFHIIIKLSFQLAPFAAQCSVRKSLFSTEFSTPNKICELQNLWRALQEHFMLAVYLSGVLFPQAIIAATDWHKKEVAADA